MNELEKIEELYNYLINEIPLIYIKLDKIPELEHINKDQLVKETLKFLFLVGKYEQALSPSNTVDLVWHELILFTRFYEKFCKNNFGRYIHHTPDDNKSANQSNFKKCIRLYLINFDKPPAEIWGDFASDMWENSQCGNCKTY